MNKMCAATPISPASFSATLDDVLAECGGLAAAQDQRRLLYHGSREPFSGSFDTHSIDSLLWTTDRADVAQTYIHASKALVAIDRSQLAERPRPPSWSHGGESIQMKIGKALYRRPADFAPEYDDRGHLRSWRIPEGFPTQQAIAAHLQTLGYAFTPEAGGQDWVQVDSVVTEQVMAKSYRAPGRLFLVLPPADLRLFDLRRGGDGDLMEPDHLRFEAFRMIIEAGRYDGVIINDFCQTALWGNVGHISFGLTPMGLARCQTVEIPAVRFEPEEDWPTDGVTEDLAMWMTQQMPLVEDLPEP
jgi:hypothetical protein